MTEFEKIVEDEMDYRGYPKYDCMDRDSPFYKMRKGDIVTVVATFNGEELDYDLLSLEVVEPVLMAEDRVKWKSVNNNYLFGTIIHIQGQWVMINTGNWQPVLIELVNLERV